MGIFGTIAEGGQTWTHRMRMLKQVVKIAIGSAILIGVCVFSYRMANLDPIFFRGAWYYTKAKTAGKVLETIEVEKNFWARTAHEIHSGKNPRVSPKRVESVASPYFRRFVLESQKSLSKAAWSSFLGVSCFLLFFLLRGGRSKKKHHISGRKLVSPRKLSLQMKLKRQASNISIGSLPLAKGTETQHILITGGTGSGKSDCIHHFLSQIRENNKKTLIVDTTGIFVDRYFREGKDVLLSPFDSRSSSWHPWIECQNNSDFEELAECFIPRSPNENENYWRTAAQSLFSSVLRKIRSKKTSELQEWLLSKPLPDLAEFVQGTKAAAHIDLRAEKTAGSIRSVASSFLGCLEYLKDTEDPFSISEWMQKDDDSCLFLLAKPAHRSSLGPLLSCWISLAFRNLLQLNPSFERRVWFVIDELPSLNKIRDLESFLAEGRKYGGCGLLALQSPSQLDSIYGQNVTRTIIGNCATKFVFSEQDPIIADLISKSFGEREVLEFQESISYGANSVRDGVSLTESKRRQPLVSSSEIQSLKKNQAFVKLPGNLPVTKVKLKLKLS